MNMHRLVIAGSLMGLVSCNAYDTFLLAGHRQESFTNKADILFIIDNSPSMVDEASSLAVNFDKFIREIATTTTDVSDEPGLAGDVDRYLSTLTGGGLVDYQIGIVTSDVVTDLGLLRPAGSYVDRNTPDLVGAFTENLICESACFAGSDLTDDPYVPGQPLDSLSRDYVTQVCNKTNGYCASSGYEEPIEAAFLAVCAASTDPHPACFRDRWNNDPQDALVPPTVGPDDPEPIPIPYFNDSHIGANDTFLRPGATLIPVIISDEGDQSWRVPRGTEAGEVETYENLFGAMADKVVWAIIGPHPDQCRGAASNWGVERYQRLVAKSQGLYVNLTEPGNAGSCEAQPFDQALQQLGELLRSVAESYTLQGNPDIPTIRVAVNGKAVPEAEEVETSIDGVFIYSDGWSFNTFSNTVTLHGSWVPDANDKVDVYYLPLGEDEVVDSASDTQSGL